MPEMKLFTLGPFKNQYLHQQASIDTQSLLPFLKIRKGGGQKQWIWLAEMSMFFAASSLLAKQKKIPYYFFRRTYSMWVSFIPSCYSLHPAALLLRCCFSRPLALELKIFITLYYYNVIAYWVKKSRKHLFLYYTFTTHPLFKWMHNNRFCFFFWKN